VAASDELMTKDSRTRTSLISGHSSLVTRKKVGHSRGVASGPGVQRAGHQRGYPAGEAGGTSHRTRGGPGKIVGHEAGGVLCRPFQAQVAVRKAGEPSGERLGSQQTNLAFASAFLVKLSETKAVVMPK